MKHYHKRAKLAKVVQLALMQAWIEGTTNWIPDYSLGSIIRKRFNFFCKDDSVRRCCADLAKSGLILKLDGKSLYKSIKNTGGFK